MQPLIKIALLILALGTIWAFQIDSPPVPLLSEEFFLEQSSRALGKINVNKATAQEFELLPGIGPNLAQAIIQFREAHGDFKTLVQLKGVKGIGEKRFAAISEFIILDEGISDR